MGNAMKDTTARLLAEQLRSAEQRAERYEAALREIAQLPGTACRIALDALAHDQPALRATG